MDYQGFITTVEREAHIADDEEAGRAACLTLHTLAQRISAGEAEDLAGLLPDELRSCLAPEGPPERFHVDEFIHRIETRLGVDEETAERTAQAVLAALLAAVGRDEFDDMRAQLPNDFGPLLDAAAGNAPQLRRDDVTLSLTLDEFVDRVAQHASRLDRDAARRASEAVLEVLAMRVSAGEIEDLEPMIPPELRPALRRGIERAGRKPRPMSVDEFVDWVAKLERVDRANATEHARAVLKAVREVVGEKEWHDLRAQLPGEYGFLLKQA